MKRQEFIDALYSAGWKAPNDAQHSKIGKLWENLFPTVAQMERELSGIIEEAHMAGQNDAGVDPSYSNAQRYAESVSGA